MYTKGPWKVERQGQDFVIVRPNSKPPNIAVCFGYHSQPTPHSNTDEAKSNAILMSLAPDLLEGLKFALPYLEGIRPEKYWQLEALIVKASPETA